MFDPVNIRASFAYGSGDDDLTDEDCEESRPSRGLITGQWQTCSLYANL